MRDLAERALEAAMRNGVTYADVRVEEARERHITTKNAKARQRCDVRQHGCRHTRYRRRMLGICCDRRNLPQRPGTRSQSRHRDRTVGRGRRRSTMSCSRPKKHTSASGCRLARSIPSVSQSIESPAPDLRSIKRFWRRRASRSPSLRSFATHKRQYFASSIGSRIDQTRTTTGAGFTAFSFKDDEIQKRSYPNSFGGPVSVKGI